MKTALSKPFISLLIRLLWPILLGFTAQYSHAQVFPADQAPPSVIWKQINTAQFQIIYPDELNREAQKLCATLSYYLQIIQHDLKTKPRKISIILDNLGVESNGFVQLAPRKSEFYATPPQSTYAQRWLDQLAIHEYRHVVQFDKLTANLGAPLELLGLAFYGVTLPPWFYEGDAVLTETLLSDAGRGRLPSWEMPLRTSVLNGHKNTYQNNYLGSFKKITAGYYEIGYFLLTKLKRDYGNSIVDTLLTEIRRSPFKLYNLSRNVKNISGYNTEDFYRKTIEELQEKWENQLQQIDPLPYSILNIKTVDSTDQLYQPQATEGGGILVLKESRHSVKNVFLEIHGKSYRLPLKIGKQTTPYFNYGGAKITWPELRTDPRFHKRNYSVINVYNMSTKRQSQLTFKSRLFSPALSQNGKLIAAIAIDHSNRFALVILDALTGKKITTIPSPENRELQRPRFNHASSRVVTSFVDEHGSGIVEFDLGTESAELLLSAQKQQLQTPIYLDDDQVVFKAHYNGIDNLYSLSLSTSKIAQITNVPYGAFEPNLDQDSERLLFNYYTPHGFRVSSIDIPFKHTQDLPRASNSFISYFKPLQTNLQSRRSVDTARNEKYKTRPYNPAKNLFNFHSLTIGSGDFKDIDQLKPQITLLSDDLLNTMETRIGVAYNTELKKPEYKVGFSYRGWFPVMELAYHNTPRRQSIRRNDDDTTSTELQWREGRASFGLSVPLRFNRYNYSYQLGLQASTSYTHRYSLNQKDFSDRFIKKLVFPMRYHFYFGRNHLQATWDLAPKWGQNIHLYLESQPFNKQTDGRLWALTSSFYFPGLFRNHSFQASFNYQHLTGQFQYSNIIPQVSGFGQISPTQPENTFLLDYRFPVAYPDLEIGNLAYVKRVRGGLFADFENILKAAPNKPRTVGLEVHADMNLFRFYLPIFDLGIKAIYVNEPWRKNWIFQFGISYSY